MVRKVLDHISVLRFDAKATIIILRLISTHSRTISPGWPSFALLLFRTHWPGQII